MQAVAENTVVVEDLPRHLFTVAENEPVVLAANVADGSAGPAVVRMAQIREAVPHLLPRVGFVAHEAVAEER